jgi:hypothetical protein
MGLLRGPHIFIILASLVLQGLCVPHHSLSSHPLTSALQPSSPYLEFQRRSNATQIPYGFDGNPDTYGVGIRLGYYTQALSV